MVKIKRINSAVVAISAALVIILVFTAMGKSSEKDMLIPKSAHTVITKWRDEKGRVIKPFRTDFYESTTIHTKIEKTPYDGASIIIKSENVKITAYKNGKILYSTEDEGNALSGERYTFVPADEIKKGDTLYLNITPKKNVKGLILSPIYLGLANDFMLTVLTRSKADILTLSALCVCIILCASYAVLRRKKRIIYLNALMLVSALYVFSKSDLFQFVIGSSEMKTVFTFASYSLMPVIFTALTVAYTKRSRAAACYQCSAMAYAVFRLVLFGTFEVPTERGIIISHAITVTGILLFIYLIKNYRESKRPPDKSFY